MTEILDEVLGEFDLCLVDFFSKSCKPCERLLTDLEIFSEDYPTVGIIKVDNELFPSIIEEYGIEKFPTLLMFRNGKLDPKHMIGYSVEKRTVLKSMLDNLTKP